MGKLTAKCIVAGDSSVGKSTLVQLFSSNGSHFLKNYSMTTGIDVVMKTVQIPDTGDSIDVLGGEYVPLGVLPKDTYWRGARRDRTHVSTGSLHAAQ